MADVGENLFLNQECPLMFTGPVGPVELCFYWLEVTFWGQGFTVSVQP